MQDSEGENDQGREGESKDSEGGEQVGLREGKFGSCTFLPEKFASGAFCLACIHAGQEPGYLVAHWGIMMMIHASHLAV